MKKMKILALIQPKTCYGVSVYHQISLDYPDIDFGARLGDFINVVQNTINHPELQETLTFDGHTFTQEVILSSEEILKKPMTKEISLELPSISQNSTVNIEFHTIASFDGARFQCGYGHSFWYQVQDNTLSSNNTRPTQFDRRHWVSNLYHDVMSDRLLDSPLRLEELTIRIEITRYRL